MKQEWNQVLDPDKIKELDTFISKMKDQRGVLITVLHEAQNIFGYLPRELQRYIGERLNIPSSKVNGVITFYSHFSQVQKGKYVVKICDGTACHVRKSIPILKELQRQLKITSHSNTTEDLLFTVETVSCLGACGLAPVITVNDKVYPAMTPEKTVELIQSLRKESGHEV